jgi:tetratricopeptide (TPR) repeat protein
LNGSQLSYGVWIAEQTQQQWRRLTSMVYNHLIVGGGDMRQNLFLASFLAAVLYSGSAFAQIFQSGVTVTLFGTFTVKAAPGVKLADTFFVVLYGSDRSVYGRQAVANGGTYQFLRVGNGDWEIAVEANGEDLLRIPFTLMYDRNTEVRKNLELQWSEKPGPTPAKAGGISAKDIYARPAGNATLMAQAQAARGKKSYGEAVKILKTIVEADPKDFEAWTELGNVLFAQGNQGEAEKTFKRALEEQPSYPLALLNLGKLNYTQKNYEAAITILSQLIKAHPESAEAHRFLGESYLNIKKGSLAVPELEEAARLDPASQADAHLRLAALYDAAGLKDRAAAEYEKFLAKKPDYPEKKKLEKYIQDNKKL